MPRAVHDGTAIHDLIFPMHDLESIPPNPPCPQWRRFFFRLHSTVCIPHARRGRREGCSASASSRTRPSGTSSAPVGCAGARQTSKERRRSELRVTSLLTPPCDVDGSPVSFRRCRLRAPVGAQRRDQGHATAEGLSTPGRAIDDEVQPASVIWRHTRRASHCCGTTRPSAATAFRATRTHACSRMGARLASSPLRAQAARWSPNWSTRTLQPGLPCPPQRDAANGSGKRRRLLRASCMSNGRSCVPSSVGMARNHSPACAPAWGRSRARELGGELQRRRSR